LLTGLLLCNFKEIGMITELKSTGILVVIGGDCKCTCLETRYEYKHKNPLRSFTSQEKNSCKKKCLENGYIESKCVPCVPYDPYYPYDLEMYTSLSQTDSVGVSEKECFFILSPFNYLK